MACSMPEPVISVIIPAYNAAATVAACLGSLRRQRDAPSFEIVVADSSTDGTAAIVAGRFPDVRLLTSRTRRFPGDARNLGVAAARGHLLAFLDADCLAAPDWLARIAVAHRAPDPAIGGTVANANPRSYVGWASYFCEFSQWMPPVGPRRMVEIPTCCLSLKRWAFDAYGPFRAGTYCSDTAFHWKLGRAGHRPLLDPTIRVAHVNRVRLAAFLAHEPEHGRAFATVRATEHAWSTQRRIGYAALTPLLPPLLFGRMLRRVLAGRGYARRFIVVSPLVALGLAAWSYGELRGYVGAPTRLPEGHKWPAAGLDDEDPAD